MAFLVLGLISCIKEKPKEEDPTFFEVQSLKLSEKTSVQLSESHPVGASLSSVILISQGFEHNINDTLHDLNPIEKIFIEDLDSNGFKEIYIFSVSAGSGSYGTIHGYASNKDKSITPIHFNIPTKEDYEKNGRFWGYRGHDLFYVMNDQLFREFPIYDPKDLYSFTPAGKMTLMYRLIPGEASWQLVIDTLGC